MLLRIPMSPLCTPPATLRNRTQRHGMVLGGSRCYFSAQRRASRRGRCGNGRSGLRRPPGRGPRSLTTGRRSLCGRWLWDHVKWTDFRGAGQSLVRPAADPIHPPLRSSPPGASAAQRTAEPSLCPTTRDVSRLPEDETVAALEAGTTHRRSWRIVARPSSVRARQTRCRGRAVAQPEPLLARPGFRGG